MSFPVSVGGGGGGRVKRMCLVIFDAGAERASHSNTRRAKPIVLVVGDGGSYFDIFF